jgi:predicted small secreted protein
MKRALLILGVALAALVSGCANTPAPAPMVGTGNLLQADAVGSLATNACDAVIARDFTQVIVARRQALRDLQAKRIGVAEARRVQTVADQARAHLDAACPAGVPDAQRIAQARAAIAQLKPGATP